MAENDGRRAIFEKFFRNLGAWRSTRARLDIVDADDMSTILEQTKDLVHLSDLWLDTRGQIWGKIPESGFFVPLKRGGEDNFAPYVRDEGRSVTRAFGGGSSSSDHYTDWAWESLQGGDPEPIDGFKPKRRTRDRLIFERSGHRFNCAVGLHYVSRMFLQRKSVIARLEREAQVIGTRGVDLELGTGAVVRSMATADEIGRLAGLKDFKLVVKIIKTALEELLKLNQS